MFFLMDVKSIFLNDDLKEEVYMMPPPDVSHSLGKCVVKKDSLWS